ncbi:four-carbon acid sugar kinase family protein [Sodalis sp. dw_96]|uniref:D-threonate kinase n=1 Tax=Sodalis sp. dw_96 TaxID=2719794 RepID=UPI001BD65358|nr:four-carbon acid sugar kinase family protein [Sodalis sp. dw_96]
MKLVVIADDFTGANDTGVQFAKKGARTEVLLDERAAISPRADVLVINTESRALGAKQAGEEVSRALRPFFQEDAGQPVIYKKIDSTFRGNVGAEIDAAMQASGAMLAIIAAAIPAAGRTTREGQCLVQGVPLVETEFASDPKTPILSSHIGTLIGLQSALPVYEAGLETVRGNGLTAYLQQMATKGPCCVVMDAELDGDLVQIAQAVSSLTVSYILVGAAGLANALPSASYLTPKQRLPVLAVAGSMSEITQRQIAFAVREKSLGIVDIDVEALLASPEPQTIIPYVRSAVAVLEDRQHCVLRTCRDAGARQAIDGLCRQYGYTRQQLGDYIGLRLGEVTRQIIAETQIGGLFLTGGDIAIAVARALGAEGYRIAAEVAPCVPCGTFVNSEIDDLPVITKAGGFGNETTLRDALYFIEEMYSGK